MIIAIDTETQGLDTGGFLLGTIAFMDKRSTETYDNKQKMWERIIELGKKEAKNKTYSKGKTYKRTLNVYGHNMAYDFYSILPTDETETTYFSQRPFIAQRDNIHFLDTYGLMSMPLEEIGRIMNIPKGMMPEKLKKDAKQIYTFEELNEIGYYCRKDAEITLEIVKKIKETLQKDGIGTKRLITSGQLGINYLTKHAKMMPNTDKILDDWLKGRFHETTNKEKIKEACIGARVEAFNLGEYEGVNVYDCNSLYPYAATKARYPDVQTEKLTRNPLETYTRKELFKKLGISTAIVRCKEKETGVLPVYYQDERIFPEHQHWALGTWTNTELGEARRSGDYVIDIIESITFEETESPLKDTMIQLYEKRNNHTGFEKAFYKQIMNRMIGKLAQTRDYKEYTVCYWKKHVELELEGWQITDWFEDKYVMSRPIGQTYTRHFVPMSYAETTAIARLHLLEAIRKNRKKMLYTDTDSLVMTGKPKGIKIGTGLGEWKQEQENTKAIVKGKKSYKVGDKVKFSGIPKRDVTEKDFKKGIMITKKMAPLGKLKGNAKMGQMVSQIVDITGKEEEELKRRKAIRQRKQFRKEKITDQEIERFFDIIGTYK